MNNDGNHDVDYNVSITIIAMPGLDDQQHEHHQQRQKIKELLLLFLFWRGEKGQQQTVSSKTKVIFRPI